MPTPKFIKILWFNIFKKTYNRCSMLGESVDYCDYIISNREPFGIDYSSLYIEGITIWKIVDKEEFWFLKSVDKENKKSFWVKLILPILK
jgi:hypothetical protein